MLYPNFVNSVYKVAPPIPAQTGLVRDRLTVTAFAILGTQAFLLNGLGSVLAPLQEQLQVSRSEVAFYPSLFALALVLVGLFGGSVVGRLGHRSGLAASLGLLAIGAVLLGMPSRGLTLVGAATLGVGAALSIAIVPAVLVRRHPTMAPAVFGEANAVASLASVLAPAAVAAALALGWGWRFGYIVPALPVIAALGVLLASRRLSFPAAPGHDQAAPALAGPGLEVGRLLPRLLAVLAAVSVEFCLVFWAAQALIEWHQAGAAQAAALGASFLVGMAVLRACSSWLTTGRHPLQVVLGGCVATTLGFFAFWLLPSLSGAAIGLFLAGAGVALMYPALLARAVAARPANTDRTARLSTLMSGLAIGGSPLVLARLADLFGLRTAYLIVPVLLLGMASYCVATLRRRT